MMNMDIRNIGCTSRFKIQTRFLDSLSFHSQRIYKYRICNSFANPIIIDIYKFWLYSMGFYWVSPIKCKCDQHIEVLAKFGNKRDLKVEKKEFKHASIFLAT